MRSEQEVNRALDEYADTVQRICFTHLKNEFETEDIFQEVFIKYMMYKGTFESKEHEKAWIIRTTINACKDILKSAYHKKMVVTEEVWNGISQDEDAFWEVREAVFALPIKYRIVIYLYYFEGYSAKEIAKMLGKTQNAVSLSLSRGRRKLREMLENDEKGLVSSYGK